MWSKQSGRSAVFLKIHPCENALQLDRHSFSPMYLREQQGEEEQTSKKLTPTNHLTDNRCGLLATTVLTLIKTDDA